MGKRFFAVFTTSMAALAALSTAPRVNAITLPDSSSCTSSGTCLDITNYSTSINSSAVVGTATYGAAVAGITNSGSGVLGVAVTNGWAVRGQATASGGVGGYFTGNPVGGTALVASCVSGGNVGTVAWLDGNVWMNGSLVNSSDARLKKEIHDIDYGLATALKLRPVSFQWKRENDAKTHLGLIAQEVEKVVPEVVARQAGPDGIESLTVNYLELVPVLMKAVQEQNKLLVEQDGRIKKLENDRSRWTLASVFEGSALVGLLPLGLVLGLRRRRAERHAD